MWSSFVSQLFAHPHTYTFCVTSQVWDAIPLLIQEYVYLKWLYKSIRQINMNTIIHSIKIICFTVHRWVRLLHPACVLHPNSQKRYSCWRVWSDWFPVLPQTIPGVTLHFIFITVKCSQLQNHLFTCTLLYASFKPINKERLYPTEVEMQEWTITVYVFPCFRHHHQ